MTSEYDFRQYQLMFEIVKKTISTVTELKEIIDKFRAFTFVLEKKDEKWLSLCMTEWWILEETYAIYADNNMHILNDDVVKRINNTRLKLLKLVEEKIISI